MPNYYFQFIDFFHEHPFVRFEKKEQLATKTTTTKRNPDGCSYFYFWNLPKLFALSMLAPIPEKCVSQR